MLKYLNFIILIIFISSCDKNDNGFYPEAVDYKIDTLVDSRDGKKYATVTYDDRTWMIENLRYRTPIGQYTIGPDLNMCTGIDVDIEMIKNSGYGYNIAAALNIEDVYSPDLWELFDMKNLDSDYYYSKSYHPKSFIRGACPEGWHIPSGLEWLELINKFGGLDESGKHLSSTDPAFYPKHEHLDISTATNLSKFSSYPVDCRYFGTDYWTSSVLNEESSFNLLTFRTTYISVIKTGISNTYSAFINSRVCLRCIKDY